MLDEMLFEGSGYALAAVLVLAWLTNSFLARAVDRAYARQEALVWEELPRTGKLGGVLSRRESRFVGLALALFVAIVGLFLDPPTRRFLGGGYLLLQVAGFCLTLPAIRFLVGLRKSGAAAGEVVRLPAVYRYRSSMSQTASLALFCLAAYALTLHLAFLGAALFGGATAVGFLRRVRQAGRIAQATSQ
jgi:hypothetical protein